MGDNESKQSIVEVKIIEKGPVVIHGPVKVTTPDGMVVVRDMCAICRCVNSKNLPYCDGSHLTQSKHVYEHEEFF